jgi:hypothetical protein
MPCIVLERIPCGEAGQLRSLLHQPVQAHLTFSEKNEKNSKDWNGFLVIIFYQSQILVWSSKNYPLGVDFSRICSCNLCLVFLKPFLFYFDIPKQKSKNYLTLAVGRATLHRYTSLLLSQPNAPLSHFFLQDKENNF